MGLNIGNVFRKIGRDIKKSNDDIKNGFEKVIVKDVGNVLKDPNNPILKKTIGYVASAINLIPVVGPIALMTSTSIADAVTKGKASEYLDSDNNSTLNFIPGMNLAQRIAHDSSDGKSSDFLKNQFLDPKREIFNNIKNGTPMKPINLVPNWVRKEIPIFAKLSDSITKNAFDKPMHQLEIIKKMNDDYIQKNMFDRSEFENRTYPNMNNKMRDFEKLRGGMQLAVIRDENGDIKRSNNKTVDTVMFQSPPFHKFQPIDKKVEAEMKKDVILDDSLNISELLIPVSIGIVVLYFIMRK